MANREPARRFISHFGKWIMNSKNKHEKTHIPSIVSIHGVKLNSYIYLKMSCGTLVLTWIGKV